MTKCLMFMVLLFAIVVPSPAPATHPHRCDSALNLKNSLDMQFDETVRYAGLTGKLIVKMYVADTGSWTLVYIAPDGLRACILAAGEKWHDVPWEKGKKS